MGRFKLILHYIPAVMAAGIISAILMGSTGSESGLIDPSRYPAMYDETSGKVLVSRMLTDPSIWMSSGLATMLVALGGILSISLLFIGGGFGGALSAFLGFFGVLLILLEGNPAGYLLLVIGGAMAAISEDRQY